MYLSVCLVLLFAAGHEGADRTVFVHEGEDVILDCYVDSHIPASEIESVTWNRADTVVLIHQENGTYSYGSYEGRVSLFSSEIWKGNCSMKLINVRLEDKGDFKCMVQTSNLSTWTTVVLLGVGFSALHILILVFCFVTLLLAFCGLVVYFLVKEDDIMNSILPICANVCMFLAFSLWSKEGFLSEVIVCSAVTIMMPLMLLKTHPNFNKLLSKHKNKMKAAKFLAVPLFHSVLTMATCSCAFGSINVSRILHSHIVKSLMALAVGCFICAPVFASLGLRLHLTVCVEVFNAALLGIILWKSQYVFPHDIRMTAVVTTLIVGLLVVLTLQKYLKKDSNPPKGPPNDSIVNLFKKYAEIIISSLFVTACSVDKFISYISYSTHEEDFALGWILLLEAILFIFVWLGVIIFGKHKDQFIKEDHKYLCNTALMVMVVALITAYGAVCFYYMNSYEKEGKGGPKKELAGDLALTVLVHVLAATCLLNPEEKITDPGQDGGKNKLDGGKNKLDAGTRGFHIVIFLFGAVGLSVVSAIALVTELFLKAERGQRAIEDLRVIVLPLEIVFVGAWLALQIFCAWLENPSSKSGST